MKIKNILLPIFLIFAMNLKGEVLPSFSIVELSTFCGTILEAKFLKTKEEVYSFLTKDIHSKGPFTDTLNLNHVEALYAKSIRDSVGVTNAEKLIIYISDMEGMEGQVMLSGYRLFKDGKIYTPFQRDNPGDYFFGAMEGSIEWDVFKERVIKVHKRITAIKSMRDIKDPATRNKQLFAWVSKYKNTFRKNCDFDADCGWGTFEWDVFKWITERENAKDTWKASQLFRMVNATSEIDWHKGSTILQEQKGSSFKTYEDIDALVNMATDKKQLLEERQQALAFLGRAVDKVYENNDPLIDSTHLAFQIKKQKSIRQSIYELMDDSDLRYNAFLVVMRLTNPLSHGLLDRTDLSHLPQIIDHYTQLQHSTEEESYGTILYKRSLAGFIARNSSAEQWRALSDSDANLFITLGQSRIDTMRNTLSFSIYYSYGKEVITELPTVVITSLKDGKEYLFHEGFEFKLPWSYGARYVQVDLKSLKLDKGEYRCHVIGKSGEANEFFWKSDLSNFTVGN